MDLEKKTEILKRDTQAHEPANLGIATLLANVEGESQPRNITRQWTGLTKLEFMSMQIMGLMIDGTETPDELVKAGKISVDAAKALIGELNK